MGTIRTRLLKVRTLASGEDIVDLPMLMVFHLFSLQVYSNGQTMEGMTTRHIPLFTPLNVYRYNPYKATSSAFTNL